MIQDIAGTQLLDPKVIADPYPFYRQLHQHAPVWHVDGTDVFTVSSYELVAEATARVEDFSSNILCLLYRDETGLPCRLPFVDISLQALATADPPVHKLHRDTVFPDLMAKRMAALEPEIADLALRCVRRAIAEGTTDFMATVGNVVPITVISRLIGFLDGDPDRLLAAAFDSTAMLAGTISLDELLVLMARTGEIGAWIADQLNTAAKNPGSDILGSIARGIDSEVLGAGEGNAILHTLLSAGGESTASLLGNAVRIMAENRDMQQQLRRHPDLLPAFIEEVLRLESPFRYHMRSIPRDTTLGDVDIPAGASLLLLWGAANRDAAEHHQPDEVVLDRRVARHHVAFGRGIHHCVGAPLARIEARVVLSTLLQYTRSITLDPERASRWVHSLMVRRHECLPVHLTPA